jgi:multiple sugar transport system substrate-binding protein
MRHHVFEGGRPALITGIAWDHRRCWGPLDASIAPYRQLTGEDVRWDRRSLYSFGEGDLGSYAEKYELVIYDHPFVGDISRRGWMLDLTAYLSVEQRAHFERDEVGASWRSYAYDGGIWGLPLDTAAQTAAWRKDLLDRHGCDVPKTLEEVRRLAESGAPKGIAVGWPSVPTDLMCTLVTIAASMGCNPGHAPGDFLDPVDADEVVGELKALARLVHPKSREWNPIRCLDHGGQRRRRLRALSLQLRELLLGQPRPEGHLRRRAGGEGRIPAPHAARRRRDRSQRPSPRSQGRA